MLRHKEGGCKKKHKIKNNREIIKNLKQMFLLRGALLVVSRWAKSNKTVSVKVSTLRRGGAGMQQKRYVWAYKLHREGENGLAGFDDILMGICFIIRGMLAWNTAAIVENAWKNISSSMEKSKKTSLENTFLTVKRRESAINSRLISPQELNNTYISSNISKMYHTIIKATGYLLLQTDTIHPHVKA